MLKISKSGAISYSELKKMDNVYEFFLILHNLELQNKKESE